MSPHERGNELCRDIKAQGWNPVWMEAVDDGVAVGVQLLGKPLEWTKAFRLDVPTATAPAFNLVANEWKRKVKREIAVGLPSTVVRKMIEAHGLAAVLAVLEEKHDA